MITLLYLAKLADLTGCEQEAVTFAHGNTADLIERLRARGEPWYSALSADNVYKVALNNVIIHQPAALSDGDTVALLPPVTGG